MIDKNKILSQLEQKIADASFAGQLDLVMNWKLADNILALLKRQPEIVRCKDCKHGRQYDTNAIDREYRELATEPDWFCADGERKKEG